MTTDWTALIAPAGVLAGSALTMYGNSALEKRKGTNARIAEARGRAVTECEAFLSTVEAELKSIEDFEDQHGIRPADFYSEYGPARARAHLTKLELHAPTSVHKAAVSLVEKFEGWADGSTTREDYAKAREAFVSEFRRTIG